MELFERPILLVILPHALPKGLGIVEAVPSRSWEESVLAVVVRVVSEKPSVVPMELGLC